MVFIKSFLHKTHLVFKKNCIYKIYIHATIQRTPGKSKDHTKNTGQVLEQHNGTLDKCKNYNKYTGQVYEI